MLIALVLAPLVFGRWTFEAFTYNKAALLQLIALAVVALAGPSRLWAALRSAWRDPAAAGALLFGLSAVVSTIASVSPRTSLQGAPESFAGLGVVLAYLVVFFAARAVFASASCIRAVAGAAAVAAAGAGAYAVVQVVGLEPMGWDDASQVGGFVRPFGTLGHPIFLGAYLAMALPLLLYLVSQEKQSGRRGPLAIWTLVMGLAVAGVVASLSRAAWLAAACGGAVFVAAPPWTRRRLVFGSVLVAAVVLVVAASWGGWGLAAGLVARLRGLGDGGGRYQIWQTAWLVFTDHPWLGSGLDTFQLVFGSRQTADYWRVEWGAVPAKAHNEILHTLATQGMLGGLALLVWGGGLAAAAARAWRRADPGDRPACAAVVAALVAFFVQAQFSFTEPGCGTLAACLAGLLAGLGTRRGEAEVSEPPVWPLRAGACLAVLVFAANSFAGAEAFGPKHALTVVAFGTSVAAAAAAARHTCGNIYTERGGVPRVVLNPCRTHGDVTVQHGLSTTRGTRAWWPLRLVGAALAGGLALVGVIGPYLADCECQAGVIAREADPAAELRNCHAAVTRAPGYAPYWTRLVDATRRAAARDVSSAGRRRWLRQALEAADRAVALVPASPMNHADRGRVLGALAALQDGDADAAFTEFDAAIAAAPRNLLFRADAGQAALDCGRMDRARQYFEAGWSVDPRFGRFVAGLGAVALIEGRTGEAVTTLEAAHRMVWYGDRQGWRGLPAQLAVAHLAALHAADAEHWAREALKRFPDEAGPHWVLAAALELEGRGAAALREYQTVVALAPEWKPARDALRRLRPVSP